MAGRNDTCTGGSERELHEKDVGLILSMPHQFDTQMVLRALEQLSAEERAEWVRENREWVNDIREGFEELSNVLIKWHRLVVESFLESFGETDALSATGSED